jgi:hypothetical protein
MKTRRREWSLRREAKEKGERVRKVKKPGLGSGLSGLGRLEDVAYKEEGRVAPNFCS